MRRENRGFSLLEVMISLSIVAAGTVATTELFHRARVGGTDAESALIATLLAQRRLEELRNSTYASIASESAAAVSSPSGYSRFTRSVTVTTPETDLKLIVVTVSWPAPGGTPSVSLQTYRSNT
jgi:prepilin-type N-terminal cleavage/methylation domain-containing protein